jgi:hypothetical protein
MLIYALLCELCAYLYTQKRKYMHKYEFNLAHTLLKEYI